MNARTPSFRVEYNGRNITADVTRYLTSLTYTDNSTGEADEISISVEDSEGLWSGPWHPTKGDILSVWIGYENNLVSCGSFAIDDVEHSGPPDVVTIRGLSATITKALRTKTSAAFEKKTLRQIAEEVATKHGLTVQGSFRNIVIQRETQNRETDLGFLKRLAADYGYEFNVRDKLMIFTSVYELEKGNPVVEVPREVMIRYSLRDKSEKTAKKAKLDWHDPATNNQVTATVTEDQVQDLQGAPVVGRDSASTADTIEIKTQANSKEQAEQIAAAKLHAVNSRSVEGTIMVEGTTVLLAGNSIEVSGLGALSGKYYITKSTHNLTRGGYITDVEVKRTQVASSSEQQSRRIGLKTLNLDVTGN